MLKYKYSIKIVPFLQITSKLLLNNIVCSFELDISQPKTSLKMTKGNLWKPSFNRVLN